MPSDKSLLDDKKRTLQHQNSCIVHTRNWKISLKSSLNFLFSIDIHSIDPSAEKYAIPKGVYSNNHKDIQDYIQYWDHIEIDDDLDYWWHIV